MNNRHWYAPCATLILAVFGGLSPIAQARPVVQAVEQEAASQDECNQWVKSHAVPSMQMNMDEGERGMFMLNAPGDPMPIVCLTRKDRVPPPRYEKIGTATRTVSRDPLVQDYFNQGLQFYYAFNNRESYRASRYAASVASRDGTKACAMCYVVQALALGPDINWGVENELDRAAANQALADAGDALKTDLSRGSISPAESEEIKLIIAALNARFAECPASLPDNCDCQSTTSKCTKCQDWRNFNYQKAIAAQFDKYQNDPDYVILFADAVMNQIPWGYWNPDGSPKCPAIKRAQETIKAALDRNPPGKPQHNGLIHWYVHLMEMSGQPGLAEPYARQLAGLAPNAGHLVHMPAHIYYRVGDPKSSIDTNDQAVKKDREYLCLDPNSFCKENLWHPDGDRYRFGYYPHNIHFELASAVLTGRADIVASAAKTLFDSAPGPATGYRADRYRAVFYLTKLNFSSFNEIRGFPTPRPRQLFAAVAYDYAQIVADTADVVSGNIQRAESNYKTLQKDAQTYRDNAKGEPNPECNPLKPRPGDVSLCAIQIMSYLARARIDARVPSTNPSVIFDSMNKAIATQDFLPYGEPPAWLYPVRQTLAGLMLWRFERRQAAKADLSQAMTRAKESLRENSPPGVPIASGVFPGNAWAYYVLWRIALTLDLPDAGQYEQKYRELWRGSGYPSLLLM